MLEHRQLQNRKHGIGEPAKDLSRYMALTTSEVETITKNGYEIIIAIATPLLRWLVTV